MVTTVTILDSATLANNGLIRSSPNSKLNVFKISLVGLHRKVSVGGIGEVAEKLNATD